MVLAGTSYCRQFTFGPPFSMRLVPKLTDQNFGDFIVQCQREKDTLYKYMLAALNQKKMYGHHYSGKVMIEEF